MAAWTDSAMRYAPKREWHATIALWSVSAMLVWAALAVGKAQLQPLTMSVCQAFYGSVILVCLGSLYGLRYAVSDEEFCARVELIRIRARLGVIESVAPGRLKSDRCGSGG